MLNKLIRIIKYYINPTMVWKGEYHSWEEAKNKSNGYEDNLILNKVFDASMLVSEQDDWFERDGTIFKKSIINPLFLSSLLYIYANAKNGIFNILDFGGAFGSVYKQHNKFLNHIKGLTWNIIEQENFVAKGKQHFENEIVHFFSSVKEYKHSINCTKVLLLSGVLQYLENPYQILDELLTTNPEYIIIDLSVFTNLLSSDDILTIQHINKTYYGKKISYPCWLFNRAKLVKYLTGNYKIVIDQEAYIGMIKFQNIKSYFSFYLFKKSP